MIRIDLNADLGEGQAHDEALFPLVTSANIACGLHAGDADVMRASLERARRHGVAAGAHPGLADRAGMGRAASSATPEQVFNVVVYQLGALRAMSAALGVPLRHVKAHGTLYNTAMVQVPIARAFCAAVRQVTPDLVVFGLPASCLQAEAQTAGLRFAAEAFLDRHYDDEGRLVPRTDPHALVEAEPPAIAARAVDLATLGRVTALSGRPLSLTVQTLCLHGDRAEVVNVAKEVHRALALAGVTLRAPDRHPGSADHAHG